MIPDLDISDLPDDPPEPPVMYYTGLYADRTLPTPSIDLTIPGRMLRVTNEGWVGQCEWEQNGHIYKVGLCELDENPRHHLRARLFGILIEPGLPGEPNELRTVIE